MASGTLRMGKKAINKAHMALIAQKIEAKATFSLGFSFLTQNRMSSLLLIVLIIAFFPIRLKKSVLFLCPPFFLLSSIEEEDVSRYAKRAMPRYENLLNDRQLAAVKTTSQFVRIIAGAGSGKTRVLTYRISYLISDMGVDPSKILAIAFTNKVATEMKQRASKLVSEMLGRQPYLSISTFHSFCARFLREEHRAFGYPIGFTIFDEDDKKQLIGNIAVELGYKKKDPFVKEATRFIDREKNKGRYPEDIDGNSLYSAEDKKFLEFYLSYEKAKESCVALDFDDLLLYTNRILKNDAAIRAKWAHRFDHILVDEFQDTNDVQFELMRLLTRPDTCVYVVGDPDQTIYTWRGANQSIILNFDKTYPGADTIILNENYRSTKNILAAANKLIAFNKKRVAKDLFTNGPDGDKIVTERQPKGEDEASWVAKKIKDIADGQRLENGDPDYRNIAILYRSSYMTRPFEMALKNRAIPYRIFGGLRFYERMEVKDMLAYFTLLTNPLDNIAFERIINVPTRGIGLASLDRIRQSAKEMAMSEYNYLLAVVEGKIESDLPTRVINSAKSFYDILEGTKKELQENLEVYSSVLEKMAKDLGYFEFISQEEDAEEDRASNVHALFDDINNFVSQNPDSTFEEYLQNVSLLSGQDDINDGNYVSLMTIHVAKGLEFDYVFLISFNDGAFPSLRSLEESGKDGEEEERRLAYVAFTRAKKKLFVSCNSGYSFATDSSAQPSRFFKEAGLVLPPTDGYYGSSWKPHFAEKKRSFFDDGPSFSRFEDQPHSKKREEPVFEAKPRTNGITDWEVGDRVHHEKFGDGSVVGVPDKSLIVVHFDIAGRKTLLASHPMISRICRKGGQA